MTSMIFSDISKPNYEYRTTSKRNNWTKEKNKKSKLSSFSKYNYEKILKRDCSKNRNHLYDFFRR